MAGAAPDEQRQALLGGQDAEAGWAAVPAQRPPRQGPSVGELIRQSPDRVLAILQSESVQAVAEFALPDKLVLRRLGEDRIATMGSSQADLPDFAAAWRRELGPCCPPAARRQQLAERQRGEGGRWQAEEDDAGSGGGGQGAAAGGEASHRPRNGRKGVQEWCSEVPVLAYVVSVKDAAAAGSRGLLRPLIRRWQAGGCGTATFQLPVVQAVVDWKWHFCRRLLVAELALFVAWLLSFFCFILAHRPEDDALPLSSLLALPRGRLAVGAELAGLAAMLPFLYIEACAAAAYGWTYLMDAWRLLDSLTYSLQAAVVVLHLGRLPGAAARALPVVAAVQCVLLLFRLQFFSRVFPATRFAFLDDLKEVLRDMRWYLAFLVLVMAGFAAAFLVLFGPDRAAGHGKREFAGLGRSFVTMVSWVAGDPNLTLLYGAGVSHPLAACLLGLAYIFSFTLVLSTLLISLMTDTLQKVTRDADARQMLSKALIIDELESTASGLLHRLWPQMHPPFLHVLRIDQSKLDAVKLDRLWKGLSDDEAEELQGRQAAAPAPLATTQHDGLAVAPQDSRLSAGQPGSGGGSRARQQGRPPMQATPVPLPAARLAGLGGQEGGGTATGTAMLTSRGGSASLPDEAPPSIRFRGSLLDAYLGGLPADSSPGVGSFGEQGLGFWGSPAAGGVGPLSGLLSRGPGPEAAGGSGAGTAPAARSFSEGDEGQQGSRGGPGVAAELVALSGDVAELRQLLLAALVGDRGRERAAS